MTNLAEWFHNRPSPPDVRAKRNEHNEWELHYVIAGGIINRYDAYHAAEAARQEIAALTERASDPTYEDTL